MSSSCCCSSCCSCLLKVQSRSTNSFDTSRVSQPEAAYSICRSIILLDTRNPPRRPRPLPPTRRLPASPPPHKEYEMNPETTDTVAGSCALDILQQLRTLVNDTFQNIPARLSDPSKQFDSSALLLSPNSDDAAFAHFHAFSSRTLRQTLRHQFHECTTQLLTLVNSHGEREAREPAPSVSRYLGLLADEHRVSKRVRTLTNTFKSCQEAIERHVRTASASRDRTEMARTVTALSNLSRNLHLEADHKEDESGVSFAIFSTGGDLLCFAVEISVDRSGAISQASITFSTADGEKTDPGLDRDLLDLLRERRYDELEEKFSKLQHWEKMVKKYPHAGLHSLEPREIIPFLRSYCGAGAGCAPPSLLSFRYVLEGPQLIYLPPSDHDVSFFRAPFAITFSGVEEDTRSFVSPLNAALNRAYRDFPPSNAYASNTSAAASSDSAASSRKFLFLTELSPPVLCTWHVASTVAQLDAVHSTAVPSSSSSSSSSRSSDFRVTGNSSAFSSDALTDVGTSYLLCMLRLFPSINRSLTLTFRAAPPRSAVSAFPAISRRAKTSDGFTDSARLRTNRLQCRNVMSVLGSRQTFTLSQPPLHRNPPVGEGSSSSSTTAPDTHSNVVTPLFHRAVVLSQLPLSRLELLPACVPLLLRQVVFNRLLSSCFATDQIGSAPDNAESASVSRDFDFELHHVCPPNSLTVRTAMGDDSGGFSLSITLAEDAAATLSARLTGYGGEALAEADAYVSHLLRLSHSIPLALFYLTTHCHSKLPSAAHWLQATGTVPRSD